MEFFKNNGKLRGLIYVLIALFTVLGDKFLEWSNQGGPANYWELFQVFIASVIAGLTTLRAYLDQHLGRNKPVPSTNPAPTSAVAALLLALMIPVMFVGCASSGDANRDTPAQQQDEQLRRMTSLAKLAAYNGAAFYLLENPGSRSSFQEAVDGLDLMLIQGDFDPITFQNAMRTLAEKANIKELRGEQGMLVIGSAVMLWEEFGAGQVELDRMIYVAPVIKSVRDGLRRALADTE